MNNIIKKGLVVAVILLFVGLAFAPSINANIGELREETSSAVLDNLPLWEEEIHYYNPDTVSHVIGTGCGPLYWMSAIRLTQDELSPYQDWSLTKVKVATNTESTQKEIWANLIIYEQGTQTTPGPVIYQDNGLYFNTTGFQIVPLKEPISINDYSELWIAFEWFESEPGAYLIFSDDGPHVDKKGCWVSQNGGERWDQLSEYGLDYNWAMGAIVEGEGAELSIINIHGPIGINAVVKNVGDKSANNLEWSITITGGILNLVNKHASGTKTKLAPGETEPISSGLFFGYGNVFIEITADADNAEEITVSKEAFLLGPFVFGIK